MTKVKLQVKGAAEVARALTEIDKATNGLIDEITFVNAQELATNAKRYAPIKTGKLRQSIQVTRLGPRRYSVGTNVRYAAYQEFGTGRYASQTVPQLPRSWQNLARKYKGRGIRQVNVPPNLYLYYAFVTQATIFIDDLEDAIRRAL